MKRPMLRFLQKRKFRLMTRWKGALKGYIGFQPPTRHEFPFALVFRAFDETLRLLKDDAAVDGEPLLDGLGIATPPPADHYMELFLTGRDVLGAFVDSDPAFCARFPEKDRRILRASLERAFRRLIEHEMQELARMQDSGPSRRTADAP